MTYSYVVTNVGIVAMTGVKVVDNKCNAVNYISGDTNGNSQLDPKETWNYTCTTTVSQTATNRVTATGNANGLVAIDTADATVVVGSAIVPPLIHLVKVPNVFVLPAGGGPVTYAYAVTNPGIVPLSNVSISDNKCTGLPSIVTGNAGDVNNNNLLDPGETWHFTCQTNLTETTTNLGIAQGSANGLTAYDSQVATVVVAPPNAVIPTLPNTGLPPESSNSSEVAALAIAVLMLGLASYVVLKRRSA